MSGNVRESATQLGNIQRETRKNSVAGAYCCLNAVFVAASHSKIVVKKQDVSCDVPRAFRKYSTSLQEFRNRSCLLSLSAINKLRSRKNLSFADVRSPVKFDRSRTSASTNIPLHLVKTKEFLKKLSIVMGNYGRSTTELEKTCGELKQASFERIAVLEGGLLKGAIPETTRNAIGMKTNMQKNVNTDRGAQQ